MIFKENKVTSESVYYRLVTLWVASEGVAGGIAHGLHIPFSGIFLSGFAVICISLIGYYSYRENNSGLISRGGILKATIIVCIFKMILSPNSPPSAYFAVLFQGFTGQLLFYNLKYFRLSCILLGFLALVESAIQRVLVLLILYGMDFWNAVNDFIKKLTHADVITNYSLWFAVIYISLHGIIGIMIGVSASRLIAKAQSWKKLSNGPIFLSTATEADPESHANSHKRRRFINLFFILTWACLLFFFLQSFFQIGDPVLRANKALMIIVRSVFILLSWYLLISPLLSIFIKKRLQKQQKNSAKEIDHIFFLLPSIKNMFKESWKFSSTSTGINRIEIFWRTLLINVLFEKDSLNNKSGEFIKQK